ncbi:MAG: hypothetical protein AAF597_00785 [Bacteroidota bacterium]
MLKHATLITVIGFILLALGMTTIFTTMVGVDIAPMAWLYKQSVGLSYLVRLSMIVVGLIMIYVGRTDWSQTEV